MPKKITTVAGKRLEINSLLTMIMMAIKEDDQQLQGKMLIAAIYIKIVQCPVTSYVII